MAFSSSRPDQRYADRKPGREGELMTTAGRQGGAPVWRRDLGLGHGPVGRQGLGLGPVPRAVENVWAGWNVPPRPADRPRSASVVRSDVGAGLVPGGVPKRAVVHEE